MSRARGKPVGGTAEVPIYTRATILDNGLIGAKPANKTGIERNADIPDPTSTADDLYALNCLQLFREMPLEPMSVQIPMENVIDNLPKPLHLRVRIAPAGGTDVFGADVEGIDTVIKQTYENYDRLWNMFAACEYIFWPIEVATGHFVTAIFHLRQSNVVESWSVVEPQRGEKGLKTVARVASVIQKMFAMKNIVVETDSYRDDSHKDPEEGFRPWSLPWVPPADYGEDDSQVWHSGIRSFALVRQLIWRVLDKYCKKEEHDESFWTEPTCGWLNIDQVRHDMMGICAVNTIYNMKWYARLAVECIERISTVEGVETFEASALAPVEEGKFTYLPGADEDTTIEDPNDQAGDQDMSG